MYRYTPVLGGIVNNVYEGCVYVQLVPYQSKIKYLVDEQHKIYNKEKKR